MKVAKLVFMTLAFVMITTGKAYAYLDAGTGSMILQLILGGLAGLAVVLKLFWHRILGLFGIKKTESKEVDSN